jgi:hypothetical protein
MLRESAAAVVHAIRAMGSCTIMRAAHWQCRFCTGHAVPWALLTMLSCVSCVTLVVSCPRWAALGLKVLPCAYSLHITV